jgi:hypothetical protein
MRAHLARAGVAYAEDPTGRDLTLIETLRDELRTFESRRDELLGTSLGKWVLVHDGELVGAFDSQADAINVGYQRFGNVPFLVKQVVPVEVPQNYVSNHLGI